MIFAAGQGLWIVFAASGAAVRSRRRLRPTALGETFPERCVMKATFTTVVACAALAGLLGLSQPATAQQKTARQCNDEWAANKASIQASGKTKRVFVAECRGVPVVARAPAAAAPAGKDQYATEAEAKASCPADTVVWVNPRSMVYHLSDSRNYGQTKQGAYMCEKDSVGAGFHPPRTTARTAT
jgi:hypothetical protein